MIRLTIDGREVSVPAGTMIVDAAAKLGIDVPVYCYHQALGPLGACRMCLVQVEKMPKLATGCTTAVAEGMVVHTSGEAVDKGRRGVLEFLLINHPLDCPVCDKGGECYLQDYTFQYGPAGGRFGEPKIQKRKDAPVSDFILIDQERCVLCQRCVRFMDEYVGENELMLAGRGVETVVTTAGSELMTSRFSGNVIDLCPVGALLSRPYRYRGRPWNIERDASVCPHCPVGCPTRITGRDGQIIRVEGRPVDGRDWGWLCDRGRFGYDFGYHGDRLTLSTVRGRTVSAAEATREVATWIKETLASRGAEAIAFIVGGTHTAEEAYQIGRFAREIVGTSRVAVSRSAPGYLAGELNGTYADIAEAQTVVYLGADPYDEAPVVHLKVRERRLRHPDLAVIGVGPRRLTRETVPGRDVVVAPGQDAAVMALALAAALPEEAAFGTLTADLGGFAPDGVSPEELLALGRQLLAPGGLVLVWDGANPEMEPVLTALAAVRTDATRVLPTFGPANWRGFEAAGIAARFDDLTAILEDAAQGRIALLLEWGADVLREYPDYQLARAALERVEYVVAEGLVAPVEADLVDAMLPGAGWGEVPGSYVNMEGRVGRGAGAANPPGQSRPVKTYLTTWARSMRKPFVVDEAWSPGADGELLAAGGQPAPVRPVGRPAPVDDAVWLIGGRSVYAGGLPSDNLTVRRDPRPGRISPEDAARWSIGEAGGELVVSRDGRELRIGVRPDPAIPPRRIYLPYGLVDMDLNYLGEGPVAVTREEVRTV